MAYKSLREFVDALDTAGQLHRITAKVSPIEEIGAISDRVSRTTKAPTASEVAKTTDPRNYDRGGKALLFENVEGSEFPVLINAYGSYHRMEMALDCTDGGFEALADKIAKLVKPETPTTLVDKLKKLPELAKIASYPPKVTGRGACQEIVLEGDDVDLFKLPVIKCWPNDGDPTTFGYPVDEQQPDSTSGGGETSSGGGGGRFFTFGGTYTKHPETGDRNVGMYRQQLLDKNHTAMHWHMHHDGARHWREYKKLGKPMPTAIVLGGESVLPYAATAPLPPGISELIFAGFLNDGPIDLVKCKTIDLEVPANAEIVIEGYVSTEAGYPNYDPRKVNIAGNTEPVGQGAVFEGPFGDHTGYYSLPDRYPIFTVTAITHRKNPIFPATIVGLPPQEDYYMGKATERIFLPLLKTITPDIIDYDLPLFSCFHNCAFIKISKEYPLQARRVMHAIWGAGQMAWTKMIIVVDEDVDVHNVDDVMFHVCANVDPARDIELAHGPVDILDHAAAQLGASGKLGIDATRKIQGEQVNGQQIRDWPTKVQTSEAIEKLINQRWKEYGFK